MKIRSTRLTLSLSCGLPLAALLFLVAALLGPFKPAAAQAPEPPAESPVTERYGDITALPVPPLAGAETPSAVTPQEDQVPDLTSSAYLYECDSPSSDKYARVVHQFYQNAWKLSSYDNCDTTKSFIFSLGGNNILPRLNLGANRLAYVSDRTGNLDIFSITPDGQDDRQLTNHGAADTQPTWSPDGLMIAFVSNRSGSAQIYLMQSDGSNARQYTNNTVSNFTPDWSPDGTKLAWVESAGAWGQIVISDVTNSRGQVAVTPPLPYLSSPQWARDGNAFVFEYDGDNDGFLEIGIVNANGTGLGMLKDQDSALPRSDLSLGSWSASGSYLAFTLIEYIRSNERWYITSAKTLKYSLISKDHMFISPPCCGFTFYPHIQPTDAAAPVTTFDPLPLYSPASGFPVNWTVRDAGPAPIVFLKVESRLGEGGAWSVIHWGYPIQRPSEWEYRATYTGNPGATVYFRGIAGDDANRIEQYRGEYSVFTRIYQWMTTGQIVDNRGNPLSGLNLTTLPNAMNELKTSITGAVTAYFASAEDAKFQPGAPGFGSPPPVNLAQSPAFLAVLPPQINAVTNGDFEDSTNPLDSWQVEGTLPASVVTGHSGSNAVQFGLDCPFPCLSEPVDLGAHPPEKMIIKTSPDGLFHVLLEDKYWTQNETGQFYGDSYTTDWKSYNSITSMAVDSSGNAFFLFYENNGIYFRAKLKDQGWQPNKLVKLSQYDNYNTAMTVDSMGRIHLLYSGDIHRPLTYEIRDAQGNFLQYPVNLALDEPLRTLQIVAGADSSVHILYRALDPGDNTQHIQVFPDGSRQTVDTFEWMPRYLDITQDGTLHAIVKEDWGTNNPVVQHWFRPPGGPWQPAKSYTSPTTIFTYGMAVDAVGNMHVLCTSSLYEPCYLYKGNKDTDFQRIEEPASAGYKYSVHKAIAIDAKGKIHILSMAQDENNRITTLYQTNATSPQEEKSSFSQVVNIPQDLHQPTLSFVYQFPFFPPDSNSGLTVTVTPAEGASVNVFESRSAPQWQHGWTDLSEWTGQTVTVTFTHTQAASESFAPVQIDEISLGAWTTPILESIDPPQAYPDPATPVTITLTGQNFMPGAQVLVDEQAVENVTWVDENHLQFSLPASNRQGFLQVTVANPSGVRSANLLLFEIGTHIYLPLTRK